MNLTSIDSWIFDMDGTLTLAVHDFEKIRKLIGLPPGQPILEALDQLPADEALPKRRQLDEIEFDLAKQAQAAPGARTLLEQLRSNGVNLGILTRNGGFIADETLRCCGLLEFFDPEHIIGRERARPKPDPDGVRLLLETWGSESRNAVVVGDFYYDLAAGKAAGTSTIYFDPQQSGQWSAHADLTVSEHREITDLLS